MIFSKALLSALSGVFSYSGRSDRLEHWAFCFLTAVLVLLGFFYVDAGNPLTPPVLWTFLIFGTWFFLAHIALFVRRLHDHGRSGFWLLPSLLCLNLVFVGWLGKSGQLSFLDPYVQGYWNEVFMGCRVLFSLVTMGLLGPVFATQGDEGENHYGDPVE